MTNVITSRTDPRQPDCLTPMRVIPISLEELPADYCKLYALPFDSHNSAFFGIRLFNSPTGQTPQFSNAPLKLQFSLAKCYR